MKLLTNVFSTFPDYFKGIRDFKVFATIVTDELNQLVVAINQILNNFYVQTCDIATLEMHERLLMIIAYPDDDVSFRRVRILERYNEHLPYTTIAFMEKLNIFIGFDSYVIEEIPSEPFFRLYLYNVSRGWLEEIHRMLKSWLPIHVGYEIKLPMNIDVSAVEGVAGAVSYAVTYDLK